MDAVVDDRTFVVGLSELFRQRMKLYEVATLLPLAEAACNALKLTPATGPIEGYYAESAELAGFFQRVRSLQLADMPATVSGIGAHAVYRLREVLTSPAMGRAEASDRVLPRSSSPFGEALHILTDWSIPGLSQRAQQLVVGGDAGLVAVAAATADPLALCIARESVALTADVEWAEVGVVPTIWSVSTPVAQVAARFVAALAESTGIVLPAPEATSAALYGQAAREADLVGRCILVGERLGSSYPFYHWYIAVQAGVPTVRDFWSNTLWTTADMRQLPMGQRPATGAQLGAPGPVLTCGREPPGRQSWLKRLFHAKNS